MTCHFHFYVVTLEKSLQLDVVLVLHTFFRDSQGRIYRNLGIPPALCRNVNMKHIFLIFHSITLAHPPPLLNIFLPSLPLVFMSLCVPLNSIRIDWISMGLSYLQERGQVISGYPTKFTPSSCSSRSWVGHGASWIPPPASDAVLLGPIFCRSYIGKHSYLYERERETLS